MPPSHIFKLCYLFISNKMKKQIILLLALVFLISLLYEVAHTPLYGSREVIEAITIHEYSPILLYAALIDTLMIVIIFAFISLINKSIDWIHYPTKFQYLLIIITGIIISTIIEIQGLAQNKWSYGIMPTIFGIGITPLVQLFITAILALWLTNR
jgi:hypothetical protein